MFSRVDHVFHGSMFAVTLIDWLTSSKNVTRVLSVTEHMLS